MKILDKLLKSRDKFKNTETQTELHPVKEKCSEATKTMQDLVSIQLKLEAQIEENTRLHHNYNSRIELTTRL